MRDVAQVGIEVSDQRLTHVGMQLRLEHRHVRVLASQDPLLELSAFEQSFQRFADILEVLPGLVVDASLGVTRVIAAEAIAAATTGKRVKKIVALGEFSKTKVEDARAVAVHQNN